MFKDKVYKALKKIPKGKVATYGQIARLAGNEKASRAVGNALHNNPQPKVVPCHRVVNAKGELAKNFGFGGRAVQQQYLEEEGVEVKDFCVDLDKYLWAM